MTKNNNQKTSFIDRAKKLGEKLFTKKNMAIAAPIVGAAAAMASKRVRTSVGDAVKSTGESMGLSGAAKPTTSKPKTSGSAKSNGSKKAAADGGTKAASKPKAAKPKAAASAKAKPATKRASKPAAKSGSTTS